MRSVGRSYERVVELDATPLASSELRVSMTASPVL